MPRKSNPLFVDLPKHRLAEFSTVVLFDVETAQQLREMARTRQIDLIAPHVMQYRKSRKLHELSAHFTTNRRTGDVNGLHVLYDLEPTDFESETTPDELIALLQDHEWTVPVRCDAKFLYPVNEWKPIFPLPWKFFEGDPSMPFDEVTGIRVAKKSDDTTLWSAVIDLQGDKFMCNPRYSTAGVLNARLFEDSIDRGVEILSRLLRLPEVE